MHQTPIKSIKHSRILLSPLNWGLGHVSRTIPIIKWLSDNKNEVIICCDEDQEHFYRNYFPELWYVPHEGYPFKFRGNGNWTIDMIKNLGALYSFQKEEKRRVAHLVEKFNPDLVISDQRFGFISKSVKSIVISHQLNLPVPKWNFIGKLWNRKLLRKFDGIWIPDSKNQELSGKLSNGNFKNKQFLGTCSRFNLLGNEIKSKNMEEKRPYDYLGIVSGPAPYNQQLLDLLINKLRSSDKKSVIIVPDNIYKDNLEYKNIEVISTPSHEEFFELLRNCQTIISRSGYSTLMDLTILEKNAILIPTPGQVEQIYLSQIHNNHENWKFKTEDEFNKMKF